MYLTWPRNLFTFSRNLTTLLPDWHLHLLYFFLELVILALISGCQQWAPLPSRWVGASIKVMKEDWGELSRVSTNVRKNQAFVYNYGRYTDSPGNPTEFERFPRFEWQRKKLFSPFFRCTVLFEIEDGEVISWDWTSRTCSRMFRIAHLPPLPATEYLMYSDPLFIKLSDEGEIKIVITASASAREDLLALSINDIHVAQQYVRSRDPGTIFEYHDDRFDITIGCVSLEVADTTLDYECTVSGDGKEFGVLEVNQRLYPKRTAPVE